tara:strand:- start:539 stop:961 length:423 start_codon:yes stop_codon:yes gene_type:complete
MTSTTKERKDFLQGLREQYLKAQEALFIGDFEPDEFQGLACRLTTVKDIPAGKGSSYQPPPPPPPQAPPIPPPAAPTPPDKSTAELQLEKDLKDKEAGVKTRAKGRHSTILARTGKLARTSNQGILAYDSLTDTTKDTLG